MGIGAGSRTTWTVPVTLKRDQLDILDRASKERGLSRSELLRRIVEAWIRAAAVEPAVEA